jgi:hypothetical protein
MFKLTRASSTQALTQMQLSADQTVLSTNLSYWVAYAAQKVCGEEPCVSLPTADFVLDLEPYDVHECIAEGSMGTLLCFCGFSQWTKQRKVKFFPIVRFGSSLCLRMVVVANAAGWTSLVADGSNKSNEINVILLTEGYYVNKYS